MKRFLLAACLAAFGLAADAKACNPVGVSAFGFNQPVVVNSFGVNPFAYQQAVAAQIRSQQLFAASAFVQPQVFAAVPQRVFVQRNVGVQAVGVGAQAVGNNAAVVRTVGLRGLIFGNVSRAR